MSIVFAGDAGIEQDGFQSILGQLSAESEKLVAGVKQMASFDKIVDTGPPKESVYIDEGFENVPGTVFPGSGNLSELDDVKRRRITSQAPQLTVYIKKRLFWSLRGEHDYKFMDSGEKLFIRASKNLFAKKCSQIAAYEALFKLDRLLEEEAEWDVARLEDIIGSFIHGKNKLKGIYKDEFEQNS
jgi:hypothetical protein